MASCPTVVFGAAILWPRTAGDGPEGRTAGRVLDSSQGALCPPQQRAEEVLGRERLPGEQRLGVEYPGDGTDDEDCRDREQHDCQPQLPPRHIAGCQARHDRHRRGQWEQAQPYGKRSVGFLDQSGEEELLNNQRPDDENDRLGGFLRVGRQRTQSGHQAGVHPMA